MQHRHVKRLRRERPYYLIPIMMGMAGVLFSSQLEDPALRTIVVLLCLAVPLFVGGNLLARIYSEGLQRWLLMAGMATLTIGAVVTVSGLTESLVDSEYVTKEVGELSSYLGMGSLLLGLLVVLYSMVRSEALIDELGDRFRHVADHMGEGFVLLDAGGTVVLINRALKDMTGIAEEHILGFRIQDLAPTFAVQPVVDHGERRRRGLASEYEAVWERDGEEMRFLVSEAPLFDRRKRRVGTLLTMHDITEEHRLKVRLEGYTQGLHQLVENRTEKLRESERRYRELLMTMNEGFLTVDRDLRIRFTNDRICRILRISPEILAGRSLSDFVHPEARSRLQKALEQTEGQGENESGQEYLFMREDGSTVPVKVSIALLEDDPDSDRSHYSLVITDVQEIKSMQAELERWARELELANEELRELDRAKDVFLSNVSHELRTPLGTLDGYIDMLQSESLGSIDPPQKSALEVMSRNVQRLTAMINEMIESSRMQIRGIRLTRELFSPQKLIDDALASAHPQALKKELSLSAHASPDLAPQWGDREKLGQVLGILLSNALKFTHEGGSVSATATQEGTDLVLTVSDSGIGIAPEYQERIFRKFFQIDSSLTRHYEGTGIGLSIAKAITQSHGGRIELESETRRGSSFRVILPNTAFAMPTDLAGRPLAGRRILVVSHSEETLDALAAALEQAGGSATRLTSGYECLRRIEDDPPDLVLLDEAVRDLSIVDALERLRSIGAPSDMAVLTLWDRDGDHEGDELVAVQRYASVLTKPFTAQALIESVCQEIAAHTDSGAKVSGDVV